MLINQHDQEIGFYINNNALEDIKKYKLVKHPWVPLNN